MKSVQELSTKAYEKAQAAQGGAAGAAGDQPGGGDTAEKKDGKSSGKGDDGSVEADYEIVDD